MTRNKACLLILFVLVVLLGMTGGAQATNYTWTDGNGDWGTNSNWDPNTGHPDGSGDTATIKDGSSTVTANGSFTVGGLTLGTGNAVNISNSYSLYLQGNFTVNNAGNLNLNSAGSTTWLEARNGTIHLSGAGSVVLGGSLANQLTQYFGNFINDSGHTIQGGGTITAGSLSANQGAITANNNILAVYSNIDNSSGNMGASGSGNVLEVHSTITGGAINPGGGSGSSVSLAGGTLSGTSISAGTVNVTNNGTLAGDTHMTGTTVNINDNNALYLSGSQTLTHDGNINVNSTGSDTRLQSQNGTATLAGPGAVVMGGGDSRLTEYYGYFVNSSGHTIKGAGRILAGITNYGDIYAEGGVLSVQRDITQGSGVMGARNGGILKLYNTVTGGLINPDGGGTGNSVSLYGGTLSGTSISAGTVNVTNNGYLSGDTFMTGTTVNINDNNGLYLTGDQTLTHDGNININSTGSGTLLRSTSGKAILAGTGAVVLGGNASYLDEYFGSFVNSSGHTIKGAGRILAKIANYGDIFAEGGTLSVERDITQGSGAMTARNGGTLELHNTVTGGVINPDGGGTGNSVSLHGGTLSGLSVGAGTVNVTNNGYFTGNNTLTGTTVNINDNNGLYLTGNQTLTHDGNININSTGSGTLLRSQSGTAILAGTGAVVLGGNASYLDEYFGAFVNSSGHTIKGAGRILAGITNYGDIFAEGGTLSVERDITQGSGVLRAQSGATLVLHNTVTNGDINDPGGGGGGAVELHGATLSGTTINPGNLFVTDNSTLTGANTIKAGASLNINNNTYLRLLYNQTLTNNGNINVNSAGSETQLYAQSGTATLAGAGAVVLGGPDSRMTEYFGAFVNGTGHTIKGAGRIQAGVTNYGNIFAENGTLSVERDISQGAGGVMGARNGGTLDLHNKVTGGGFFMSQNAALVVHDNLTLALTDNFIFYQKDTSKWNWGNNTTLAMNGGGGGGGGAGQRLEIGGLDQGNVAGGFSNNFNLVKFAIGDTNSSTNTLTFLSDWINNDHRGGSGGDPEALYVDSLFVGAGDVLNLNNLHLYVKDYGLVGITGDWEGSAGGGGRIINELVYNPVPVPSTLLLLGSGLLGLAGLGRRRFRKS